MYFTWFCPRVRGVGDVAVVIFLTYSPGAPRCILYQFFVVCNHGSKLCTGGETCCLPLPQLLPVKLLVLRTLHATLAITDRHTHTVSCKLTIIILGFVDIDCNSLFHVTDCESVHTHGRNLRLYKDHCNVNCRLKAFVCRNINVWNRLPAVGVNNDSVAVFKRRLACVNLVNFCSYCTY